MNRPKAATSCEGCHNDNSIPFLNTPGLALACAWSKKLVFGRVFSSIGNGDTSIFKKRPGLADHRVAAQDCRPTLPPSEALWQRSAPISASAQGGVERTAVNWSNTAIGQESSGFAFAVHRHSACTLGRSILMVATMFGGDVDPFGPAGSFSGGEDDRSRPGESVLLAPSFTKGALRADIQQKPPPAPSRPVVRRYRHQKRFQGRGCSPSASAESGHRTAFLRPTWSSGRSNWGDCGSAGRPANRLVGAVVQQA